ncbi:G-type lectin S-receptor-like serine/threonine-protein kinase LECRK3 [Mangifera indica]|uniref:G-type lectin S-receptor-like serine/threonine-protein kinase LECRK3 n=1 Tax=Mangifera indica TaxID=29780 RepID=UPI001CFBCE1A|nr:G-type lectin S-receptor-like serine/threonine-protein kinase LECRK3 [Mangifera indica]
MASPFVVFLLSMIFQIIVAQHLPGLVSPGSSLFPTRSPMSWDSPSGHFKFGFYEEGSGYSIGIWLQTSPQVTIVWTANRDYPPVSPNATLTLTLDGKLILTDQNEQKPIVKMVDSASFASMFDSGNFVLFNKRSDIIWSSFDFPTDTILEGQNLRSGSELFSSVSKTNHSTGRYRLKMQSDGNLVLYPINTIDKYTEAYWASATDNKEQHHLFLNYTGDLVLLNSTMATTKRLGSDSTYNETLNSSTIYLATLGYNGIFSLFAHFFVIESGAYNTSTNLWSVPETQCDVKSFCGLNSYCTLDDKSPVCRCIPGTNFVDPNQQFSGCKRNFTDQSCKDVKKGSAAYNISSMDKITWEDYPYVKENISGEDCRKSCFEDCNCDAALHDSQYCTKYKLPLKSAKRLDGNKYESYIAYFKIGTRAIKSENSSSSLGTWKTQEIVRVTSKKTVMLILLVTIGFITCSCVFLAVSGFFMFKYRVAKYKWLLETGNFGSTDELTLRSFSYSELKRATNRFKENLGRGSFGAVYKGVFHKGGKLVAVKRLEKMMNDSSEREFHAEMQVIGRTHHKNLVRLLGYCAEDSKRLLVYEYMSNGSLADLLFSHDKSPEWSERVRIALDVARGILYLHDECKAPIIHCDIKPQNILMDDFWTAKISDFGLAKLLMPDQTRTFTLVRGTRGYMAPEWSKNMPISVKADVYSYGVVLLEIVCCRRNMELDPSKPEEIVLINWVYKCFINRELNKLVRGQEVDKKTLENMVKVGLWCVQDEQALRPSMKSVVMMLEGITDVSIPPCPSSSSG